MLSELYFLQKFTIQYQDQIEEKQQVVQLSCDIIQTEEESIFYYFPDLSSRQCLQCDNNKCLKCIQSKSTCVACNEKYLFNNSCLESCPRGYRGDKKSDEHHWICIKYDTVVEYYIKSQTFFLEWILANKQNFKYVEDLKLHSNEDLNENTFTTIGNQIGDPIVFPKLKNIEFSFKNGIIGNNINLLSTFFRNISQLEKIKLKLQNNGITNLDEILDSLKKQTRTILLQLQIKQQDFEFNDDIQDKIVQVIQKMMVLEYLNIDIFEIDCLLYNQDKDKYLYPDFNTGECKDCLDDCRRCITQNECLNCNVNTNLKFFLKKDHKCYEECPDGYQENQINFTCDDTQNLEIEQDCYDIDCFKDFIHNIEQQNSNWFKNIEVLQISMLKEQFQFQQYFDQFLEVIATKKWLNLRKLNLVFNNCNLDSFDSFFNFFDGIFKLQVIDLQFMYNQFDEIQISNVISDFEKFEQLQDIILRFEGQENFDDSKINVIKNSYEDTFLQLQNLVLVQIDILDISCQIFERKEDKQIDIYKYFNFQNQKCEKCNGNCQRCGQKNFQNVCITCVEGTQYNQNTQQCDDICPKDYVYDLDIKKCVKSNDIDNNLGIWAYIGIGFSILIIVIIIAYIWFTKYKKQQQKHLILKNLSEEALLQASCPYKTQKDNKSIVQRINSKYLQNQIQGDHEYEYEMQNSNNTSTTKLHLQNESKFQKPKNLVFITSDKKKKKKENIQRTESESSYISSLQSKNQILQSGNSPVIVKNPQSNELQQEEQFNFNVFNPVCQKNDKIKNCQQMQGNEYKELISCNDLDDNEEQNNNQNCNNFKQSNFYSDLQNNQVFITNEEFKERYKVIQELGQGSFGKVFKYLDIKLQQKVAIKEIDIQGENQEYIQKEAYNEILNLQQINKCQNVVKFYRYHILEIKLTHDSNYQQSLIRSKRETNASSFSQDTNYEEEDYKVYKILLVMELGQISLDKLIFKKRKQKERFTQEQVLKIFIDLIIACNSLQLENLAHRDIKPRNIILIDGNWKLCDFGAAKYLKQNVQNQSITQKHTMIGTVNYLSPEQKTNYLLNALHRKEEEQPLNPFSSDVFSLGLSFYEIMSMQQVVSMNDREDLLQVNLRKFVLNTQKYYDEAVLNMVCSMLQWNPKFRPTFSDLLDQFDEPEEQDENLISTIKQ